MFSLYIKTFIVLYSICVCTLGYSVEEKFHTFNISYSVNNTNQRVISVGLILVDIIKHRNLLPNDIIYNEILSYSKQKPFGDEHGRSTNVHETVHGINNELRNFYKTKLKKQINAFYAGAGKSIVIKDPSLTLRDIIPYIPSVLRGYRYNLYFVKQIGDWNDVPTYPMDEWSAYIAGAECAVDDFDRKIPIEKSDYVSGSLEFSIYCTSLALAVKNKDPEYWKNHEQFKNAMQYFLIKSERIFFKGKKQFPLLEQDRLLEDLRNHPDAKELRDFLLSEFQGIFVD